MWVEINTSNCIFSSMWVTSHTGCVSRNEASTALNRAMASHPTRDVWVEMRWLRRNRHVLPSHPTRDVWVEILQGMTAEQKNNVTSHTGCVSRNSIVPHMYNHLYVTSHTGCVSRNTVSLSINRKVQVTSHTGCVSRNTVSLSINRKVQVTSHTGCVSRNEIILENK